MKRPLDLRTLWEIVKESERREWTLDELADLCFGEDPGSDRTTALSRGLDEGYLFTRYGRKFTALAPEVVAQQDRAACEAKCGEEWFRDAGAWLRSVADGRPGSPPEHAERAIQLLEAEVLFGADHPEAHDASKLMQAAYLHGQHAAFGVLVKLGHWDEHENLDLLRNHVPIFFSSETMAEAETCDWTGKVLRCPALWRGRVYGIMRREGDCYQAFSIRRGLLGYIVGIHFASPAFLIPQGGCVQAGAADRGAAIYLPDRLVPMLPPEVTSKLRLTTEARRPTLTVEVRLNGPLRVRRSSITVKRIRVTHALTLDDADQRIAQDTHLSKLHALARHLRGKRREAGAVLIPEPQLEIAVRDHSVDVRLEQFDRSSRVLWRELTLLAGSLVGAFCVKKHLPSIYRVRESPSESVMAGDEYDPVTCREQKRRMPRERLQVLPDRHSVLGLERLAVVDGSVERYPDLLMHQQLVHFLRHRKPIYSTEELKNALLYTRCARDTVQQVERSSRRYWLLKYMEQFIGKEVEAVVLDRARSGYLVELCETLLWVFVRTGPDLRLSVGTKVRVLVAFASARLDELRMIRPHPVHASEI